MTSGNSELLTAIGKIQSCKDDLKGFIDILRIFEILVSIRFVEIFAFKLQCKIIDLNFRNRICWNERKYPTLCIIRGFLEHCKNGCSGVDLALFHAQLITTVPFDTTDFKRRGDALIKAQTTKLPKMTIDPKVAFFLPETQSGQIIERDLQIQNATYGDLENTVQSLLEIGKTQFTRDERINELFNCA
jgi:hypothetical protein